MNHQFAEASKIIYEVLDEAVKLNADDGESLGDIQIRALGELLRGEQGRPPQQILLEVSVALERNEYVASALQLLKPITADLELGAYRMTDRFGRLDKAVKVLTDRMLGPEGFVSVTNLQFAEIKINMVHINAEMGEEQDLYWRRRVKRLKYDMIAELKHYVRAARSVVDSSSHLFSSLTSQAMNKAISLKQAAEIQQTVLIKVRDKFTLPLNSHELEVANLPLLMEFMNEAVRGSSAEEFSGRLQALIERSLPLELFEAVYTVIRTSSSREWSNVQTLSQAFGHDIEAVLDDSRESIDKMIDVMNIKTLPNELASDALAQSFVATIQTTLVSLEAAMARWRSALKDAQNQLGNQS